MTAPRVACLHPGEMGSAVAALLRRKGCEVAWTAAGRSAQTRARAERAGLVEAASLADLCASSELILSICPPHAALDVAQQVSSLGYRGIYVDANAISPSHAQDIQRMIHDGGGTFVDAAIVGPPPRGGTDTVLYLCGAASDRVARLFSGSDLQLEILGPEIGKASAIKMCHSAMHKGLLAMQLATLAGAEKMGVRMALERLFAGRASTAAYVSGMDENVRRARKAWRFAGEMDEVAQTLGAMGLPTGFHRAAGDIFQRLASLQDGAGGPSVDRLLNLLVEDSAHAPSHER